MKYLVMCMNIMVTHFKIEEVVIFTNELRYSLSIDTIKYSDTYNDNFDLFNRGIQILETRLKNKNYEEFDIDERETLEQVFQIINECQGCKYDYQSHHCIGCDNYNGNIDDLEPLCNECEFTYGTDYCENCVWNFDE